MKKLLLTAALLLPVGAHAILIDGPSAHVFLGGSSSTLDVVAGADISVNSSNKSISGAGFDLVFNISGGVLQGGIGFSGFRHTFNISGGLLGGPITGSGFDHVFNFTGFDLVRSGNTITGTLLDGSLINTTTLVSGPGHVYNIINVPRVSEPGTLALLGLAIGGLLAARRRLA
ncbi:MAG: PEP-CTERM sorting domain-containing protein [Pseudomonadota bacterium]